MTYRLKFITGSQMPKLIVAGCSFSAPSRTAPGTSWAEYMAKDLGWELSHLARQGISNGGVRLMIEECLRQRPDFAVITPTFWDRFEIPADSVPYDWDKNAQDRELEPYPAWDPRLQQHLQTRRDTHGYDRTLGVNNVNYGTAPSRMIFETIFSLAENFPHAYRKGSVRREVQTAVKHYIDCLYDSNWKKQQDEWIIMEGIMQMYLAGLKFLVVPCLLWPWDPERPRMWREIFPAMIPDHYIMFDSDESPLGISGSYPCDGADPGYHMSAQGQRVIADNYLRRMRRDHGLG